MSTISIAGRTIGRDHSCFIVAEAGVNHNGELHLATRLVEAAAEAGANAVKFQTFVAENIVTPRCRKATYQLRNSPASESQLEMLRRLQLSPAAHRELHAFCRSLACLLEVPAPQRSCALRQQGFRLDNRVVVAQLHEHAEEEQ